MVAVFSLFSLLGALGAPPTFPYGQITHKPKNVPSSESKIVDRRLLNRVARILSQGGDGSEQEDRQEREGHSVVGSDLFERIARIISQNEGQTSYHAPALNGNSGLLTRPCIKNLKFHLKSGPAITPDYGVQRDVASRIVGGSSFQLGQPEPARRIASFDLTEENSVDGDQYDDYSQSGGFMFIMEPQQAERIASFAIPAATVPKVNGGY